MTELYPLKFDPIFKNKIWGGKKINQVLNKDVDPADDCGESWELSAVQGSLSVVSNGDLKGQPLPDLIEEYQERLVGHKTLAEYGNEFPLLVKFIDANKDLSIQVHPDDELAQERHQCLGKTEMWYVMDAEKDASLVVGFNQEISKEKYLDVFNAGKLTDILNTEKVSKGDVFYIPAGRVHTIGKGLLIAEIQQTSDVTYRIYDFDRKDAQGNTRELHVDEALDAIDYNVYDEYKTLYEEHKNLPNRLVKSKYFSTQKLILDDGLSLNYSDLDSFVIYTCVAGQGTVVGGGTQVSIKTGEVILIPASLNDVDVIPDGTLELLETYV